MARKRVPFVRCVVGLFSVTLIRVIGRLPLGLIRAISPFLARLIYFLPRVRHVGLANLDLAYGDTLSAAEKRRILLGSVHNMVRVALEFPWTARFDKDPVRNEVEIQGLENFDRSCGAIMIGGHIGNWEWMPPALADRGFAVAIVVRPLDDSRLNAFIEQTRSHCGVEVLSKEGAGREVIARIREGKIIGIAVDQSPRQNGAPVRFFGQPCWGTIGPAMLAARTHIPVHPVAIARKPDNTYLLEILPALEMARTGNMRADLIENAQRCQDAVEALIRQNPDQWLWPHRRWKERPGLERDWQRIAARLESSKKEMTRREDDIEPEG